MATWLGCHRSAFEWFRAVPSRLIIDNPNCAISKTAFSRGETVGDWHRIPTHVQGRATNMWNNATIRMSQRRCMKSTGAQRPTVQECKKSGTAYCQCCRRNSECNDADVCTEDSSIVRTTRRKGRAVHAVRVPGLWGVSGVCYRHRAFEGLRQFTVGRHLADAWTRH